MAHEKVKLTLPNGNTVDAIAPVILSVSRSTDIPAFHFNWFMNRWKAGYSVWNNPYTNIPQYISYEKVKGIVFWTKNPHKKIIDFQKELDEQGIHTYFQYTLNDYEKEGFEPNLPSLDKRIETFINLSDTVGADRVIWRFDPLMPMNQDELIGRIENIGNKIKGYTNKLVFSFVDINCYKKVQTNLLKYGNGFTNETILDSEYTPDLMNAVASRIAALRNKWKEDGWDIELATCGEKFNLEQYGIQHNRCIDSEQFRKIAADDTSFLNYLDYGGLLSTNKVSTNWWKDKGQRKECGCMLSKDVGAYNTCPHFCIYCYANASREAVKYNCRQLDADSETLIPNK